MEEKEIRKERLKELEKLGYSPHPYFYPAEDAVSDIVKNFRGAKEEELEKLKIKVSTAGRILTIRRMGKATFLHITDGKEKLQIFLRENTLGKEKYSHFKHFNTGDWIGVKGLIFKTKTGELTVLAEDFTLLAKSLLPLPEKWHGLQDVEVRFRKRYLDLIVNRKTRDIFEKRARILRRIRKFLEERGFVEVETPMMHSVLGGAAAKPFVTHHNALDMDLYLRIAPELYLKRLVVGGMERVFEIGRNFRNEGISPFHNPEFTMLEFYWAYKDYNFLMDLTEELFCEIAMEVWGGLKGKYQGRDLDFTPPWKRLKFMDTLSDRSGIPVEKLWDEDFVMKKALELFPEEGTPPSTYGKALDFLFDKFVKEELFQPTFIIDFPKVLSPLAKEHRNEPRLTERFELFVAGMEVANAFSELTDPDEQKARFEDQVRRKEEGAEVDLDYIEALSYGLPPTAGEGVGIDRTVMIFTDSPNIREVILFPLLRKK
ncbi:MAG: lysine--tRNA ligase [Candidatus Aminicenantes bacterium]|nr:lysine--tRNA ligase [Candidatus Aminicenantes bacterium]